MLEYIYMPPIRQFLSSHDIKCSSLTKNELISKLIDEVQNKKSISTNDFENFLVHELIYGRNNIYYINRMDNDSSTLLENVNYRSKALSTHSYPTNDFNHILCTKTETQDQILFMQSSKHSITFLLSKYVQTSTSKVRIFPVLIINPKDKVLVIKITSYSREGETYNENVVYHELKDFAAELFSINFIDMSIDKKILYDVYKNLTERLIEPFNAHVNCVENDISNFLNSSFKKCGINTPCFIPDAQKRVHGIIVRYLIFQNWKNFFKLNNERLGYVHRVHFSDMMGARISTTAPSEQEIETAEIFFDTKETIDSQECLNTIFVKWFYHDPEADNKISTKIEANKDHLLVHFTRRSMTPEVEHFVFSSIRSLTKKWNFTI